LHGTQIAVFRDYKIQKAGGKLMLASGLFRFTNSFYLWNWLLPFERLPERDDVLAPVMFIENEARLPLRADTAVVSKQ
jgi:hypothetical protein